MGHRSNLDILRACAVSCVLVHHLLLTLHSNLGFWEESQRHYAAALGHMGVLAFFVHTSLVLMYSLERMHAAGDHVTVPFYIRRFFRIYPLSIAAIAIATLFHVPSQVWDTAKPVSHAGVIANLLLVQNLWTRQQVLGPLWSLPYEVQMYVVLPALYLIAVRKKALLYLFVLFAAFCLFGLILETRTSHLNMAAYVPCFLAGVLCYALRRTVPQRLSAALWPVFLLAGMTIFLVGNKNHDEPTTWSGWVFCLVLGMAINAFRDSRVRSINVVAEKVALYSYGMYLLHIPVLYLLFVIFGIKHAVLGVVLFFALTGLVSVAAFHLLESPFIDLGRRLSSPRTRTLSDNRSAVAPAP